VIEDGAIKIYFTPTLIALINIQDTYRQERYDLELVGLCQFRVGCDLANSYGSCPYVYPGRLGYYSQEVPITSLSSERQQGFQNAYKECPRILEVTRVILARAAKKATNTPAYPLYVVHSRLSKTDLQTQAQMARLYRRETLMLSSSRWKWTVRWLNDIFGVDVESGPDTVELEIGSIRLPVRIVLHRAHAVPGKPDLDYKAIRIPEQRVVNDKQDPRPLPQSGGWLFINSGAYDRQDIDRPFDKVNPYLIVPNQESILTLARTLMNVFSNGKYISRARGDQEFTGINCPESQEKYNCQFVNVWDEEEDVFLVDGSEADYWRAVQDVKREWSKHSSRDSSRIAIVIIPGTSVEGEETTLYYNLKKVFLEEGLPSQFITLSTLRDLGNQSIPFGPVPHSVWLNVYTKLGGKPWRLSNQLGNVHCFIGIGFGLNPRRIGNHIYAGVAHVFDKYGSWIDVASDWKHLSESEREGFEGVQRYLQGTSSFKISQSMTQSIVYDALRLYEQYQSETQEPAKNIVLHKLGRIYECEIVGFMEGIRQTLGTMSECNLGILQIEQDHKIRLYGDEAEDRPKENRTVFRGMALVLGEFKAVLATTGRVSRGNYTYYPGIGTPQPLLLTSHSPSPTLLRRYGCNAGQFYDIDTLTRHVMALTQLHWGSTKENIRLPITALYAHKVADLIFKTGATVDTWSTYHRPWFL
jgi:hypothetical protein